MPVFLECDRCTACCRWPGQVKLSTGEIEAIAAHLGIGEGEFIQRYARLNASRTGLALQDRPDGACIFLEGDNCRVQQVKPQQCRDFPNLWRHPDADKLCRAVPREVSEDEYVRLVSQVTQRTPEGVREILRHQS